ncbi:hypothetical protein KL86PLE_40089 [uncultured Pleomorphomonas sp.]|uniref:Uncharacterized protein n=1 Tax=uncultured Pleomorphomonas sp. TaxID=442121 RepID=A0A212LFE2_9HYPH|nr:hypothetical protein KL86PLE_40089 [uncultured Pleomorphomonas sp.]
MGRDNEGMSPIDSLLKMNFRFKILSQAEKLGNISVSKTKKMLLNGNKCRRGTCGKRAV